MVAGLVYIFSTKSTYVFIIIVGIFNTFLSHGAVLVCICTMYVCNYIKCFLSLEAVCVFVCMHVDVWGELASHKRSLTHRPSSQGWASRCP